MKDIGQRGSRPPYLEKPACNTTLAFVIWFRISDFNEKRGIDEVPFWFVIHAQISVSQYKLSMASNDEIILCIATA